MEKEPWLQHGKRLQAPKPDGAEAWRVAFAACFINFIMAGIGRTSGILYVKFIDIFHTDRKQASLPFTVRSMARNLTGPLVGILGQKYGTRPIIIVGGIIGTLSAASCFYVEDIFWMTVAWGCCNGFGASLITTLTQASIGEHFEKHRSTASGMGYSGGCVGSFIFPAILDFLLYEYNLNGTFLFIAGIIMHVIPAAIIMKKPTWLESEKRTKIVPRINLDTRGFSDVRRLENVSENGANVIHETEPLTQNRLNCSSALPNTDVDERSFSQENPSAEQANRRRIDEDLLWKYRQLVVRLLTDDYTLQKQPLDFRVNRISSDFNLISEIEDLFCRIVKDVCKEVVDYERDSRNLPNVNGVFDEKRPPKNGLSHISGEAAMQVTESIIFFAHPINCLLFYLENLFEKDRSDIIQSFSEDAHEDMSQILDELWYIHSVLYDNKEVIHVEDDNNGVATESSTQRTNTFCSHIKAAFMLHTKPLFILISLCRSSHFLTLMPIFTTVVDFSRDKGLPEHYGKYVIAAISSGDLIARLCTGWITDRGFVSLPRYMLILMILQGISTAILSFMNSTASLLVSLFVYGLLQGCVFIQHPVLVSHYLGKDEQSIALGCINFFSGILAFVLPSYIGYFRDTIGSYNGMFYINGTIAALVGFLWVFEPYLVKISPSQPTYNQETPV